MIINKVIQGGSVLLDLTQDTVNENNLLLNETAHNSEGEPVRGAMPGGTTDYNALTNKPSINGEELSGNKTSSQLGLIGSNEKGANNGVASLGADGKVPSSQIPTADNVILASAMTIGGQTVTEVESALHALKDAGGGSSGGHTILNESGTELPQRSKLQFEGCEVTDDSTNDITKIKAEGGVTGVKGNAETNYRIGNVNLTPADIGALAPNGASTNTTVAFTSNDLAANTTVKTNTTTNQPSTVARLSSGETLASMFNKISSMFASIRKLWNTVGSTSLENGQTLTNIVSKTLMANNAGAHNAIYRGKALGSSVTSAQYDAIDAGTFEDLYIGDYWTIDGVNYRIAAFDYWLNCGDQDNGCTDHHVVIVPDTNLDTQKMNDSNVTTGGYVGSKMYTTYMATAKSTIQTAFGSANILSHRELFTNAVSSDKAIGWAWYDSTIDLMNESMVYGHEAWASHPGYETTIDKGQLPLFQMRPDLITNRAYWWLRDVVSGALFAYVNYAGHANHNRASDSSGVRPAFAIYKPQRRK